MKSNKAVLKDYQETAFIHPIAQSNGYCPQGVIVRERHERNYFKSGHFMLLMSLQWKSTYNQGKNYSGYQGNPCFFRFGMKG